MTQTQLPVIEAAADERTTSLQFLDYFRAIVRRKAEDLPDAQLRVRLHGHPSPLTIGGILKHLAWVEVKWARAVFLGTPYEEIGEPWATRRGTDPQWEWDVEEDSGTQILGWYDEATAIAREAYGAADSLDQLSVRAGAADPGVTPREGAQRYALRFIVTHLIEEYARHAGHLDLLREQIDGRTGD